MAATDAAARPAGKASTLAHCGICSSVRVVGSMLPLTQLMRDG
jgi:hypothetical protein